MLLPSHLTPFARPAPTFHVYECAGCKAREEVAMHPLTPPSDVDGFGFKGRSAIYGWVTLGVVGAGVPAVLCADRPTLRRQAGSARGRERRPAPCRLRGSAACAFRSSAGRPSTTGKGPGECPKRGKRTDRAGGIPSWRIGRAARQAYSRRQFRRST